MNCEANLANRHWRNVFVTEAELQVWGPGLRTVVVELRRSERPAVADLLIDAVRAGATSSEILGGIGTVLREHRALRTQLNESAARVRDAVMADVDRALPGSRLAQWFARFTRPSR